MTRGNQRELARKKMLKKQQGHGKKTEEQAGNAGTTLTERKQRDADKMREKQQKAMEKKAAETAAGTAAAGTAGAAGKSK